MILPLLVFLIIFPLAVALILFLNRKVSLFPPIIYAGAALVIFASLGLLLAGVKTSPFLFSAHQPWVEPAIFAVELAVALFLLVLSVRRRDSFVTFLIILQTAIMAVFHFMAGHNIHAAANLFLDQFSVMMGLIIGVVGGLIAIYAIGYMADFHQHHQEVKDNRRWFFGLIFLFLGAMFGVCFANNLLWLYFFWEITTVCSFLLIGYKQDEQSTANAFWALRWNLLGGLAFLLGIIVLFLDQHTVELNRMMLAPQAAVMLPAVLIAFAGMTKSAQMPFSSWLVGAMVAPTPVSALLHSSTMVKAGVYIILRFASVFEGTFVGSMVALVGGVTFLIGSFICISQNDAKKVLAYSTIANLGLIVLCAGIGTYESLWAGMLLIIFHAISKGLLFLCVGTIEHQIHSRKIEDMTGLIMRLPKLSIMLQIGIAGMFLAPFGMLISKWVVLRAIVDYNPIFAILLVFGSAATVFFWVKWLGKVIIVDRPHEDIEDGVNRSQWIPLTSLAVMTVLICGFFSQVAHFLIEPYVIEIYGKVMHLSSGNVIIMSIMLTMVCLFPLTFWEYGRGVKVVDAYLGGANTASGEQFRDSFGKATDADLKNYYMEEYFGEQRMSRIGVAVTIVLLAVIFVLGVI